MLALIYVLAFFVLASCNRIENGQFFIKTSGASNEDAEDNQQNVLNEDFFSCNTKDSCATVSKKSGKTTEIWEKVLPRYVIPKTAGTALMKKKWLAAREYCVSLGADLLSIENSVENERVVKFVKNSGVVGSFWIGLNDREKEGNFVWSDGRDGAYTNWNGHLEPNNDLGIEHCVGINTATKNLKWNDLPCHLLRSFICEFKN